MIKLIRLSSIGVIILFYFSIRIHAQPGCPNVDAGNNATVNCTSNCTTLNSTFLQTGETTSYSVTSIPYSPPYSYSSGTGIIMNIDDVWSSLLTLPFNFCFFGQVYNKIVIGSNGLISFNTSYASGFCPWSYSATCPSTSLPLNCIFGPYHDIDPDVGGTIKYAMLGTYPCRTFVISFYQVPMYSSSCNSLKATHQIVLYETTNVIEVYMQNKPTCTSWNGGRAIVGIQNSNGTIGYSAPGRNSTQWTVSNEAWRFTPNGTSNVNIQWLQGTNVIGTGTSIQVCPAATTTYTVKATYTNCDATTVVATDNVTVTFNNNLNPSISPVNPTVCSGNPVTVTASGADSYQWSDGLGSNPSVTVNPTSQTTYTVTATSGSCTTTRSVQVNVNPIPNVQASNNPQEICIGQTSQLSATGASTYAWSPSTGLSSSSGAVVNSTPTSPGTYTYTVTGTASGCTNTASTTIIVNPNPVMSISPSPASICLGESVNLTASGASSVTWAPSNGLNNTNQLTVTSTPSNTQTYTVTGNENGCTGTAQVTVTIKPKPIMTINPASIQICSGDTTTLTAGGAASYLWLPSEGLSSNSTNQVQANPSQTTTYSVIGTTDGCMDSIHATVTVISNPSISINPPTISICPGETATLVASGGINYTWSPSTGLNCTNTPTVQSTPTETVIYTVVGTTDGCNGTAQAEVIVKSKPIVSVSPQTATICLNENVDLVASGADSYVWCPVNGLSSSTLANVSASPTNTTTYTVIGTTNSCKDSTHITVNVNPLPIIDIQSDKTEGCAPSGINYSVFSNPALQSCVWQLGNGQSSTLQNPSTIYMVAGQYSVSVDVVDVNGCQNSLSKPNYISIHPTPVVDFTINPEMGIQEVESSVVSTYTQSPATWSWKWGDGLEDSYSVNSATHTYLQSGIYFITHTVETQYGCIDSIRKDYTVIFDITIPNVFTPNGDGVNETFVIDGIEFLPNCHLVIYNRWGRIVYQSDFYKNDWDGGDCAEGTYYYVFVAPISNTKPFSGSVSLYR